MGSVVNRLYRGGCIAFTALVVWLRYEVIELWDKLRGRDPKARDLSPIHQRNADLIFATVVSMRGMLV